MFPDRWFAAAALGSLLLVRPAVADNNSEVRPEALYKLELRVRKPAEKEFTRDSRTVPVHVTFARDSGRLFYATEEGKSLALVITGKAGAAKGDKAPRPLYRLLLPVRGWDEKEF